MRKEVGKKISFLQLWESLGGTCGGRRWLWRLENRLQRYTMVCCCHLFLVLYPHSHCDSLMLWYLRTFQDKKWYPFNMFLNALASFSFSKSFCLMLLLKHAPELNAIPNSLSHPHLHTRASHGSCAVRDQRVCKETTWQRRAVNGRPSSEVAAQAISLYLKLISRTRCKPTILQ